MTEPTLEDLRAVAAFHNFLSWAEQPLLPRQVERVVARRRYVPPAWWAYALGHTEWCPPRGEW